MTIAINNDIHLDALPPSYNDAQSQGRAFPPDRLDLNVPSSISGTPAPAPAPAPAPEVSRVLEAGNVVAPRSNDKTSSICESISGCIVICACCLIVFGFVAGIVCVIVYSEKAVQEHYNDALRECYEVGPPEKAEECWHRKGY